MKVIDTYCQSIKFAYLYVGGYSYFKNLLTKSNTFTFRLFAGNTAFLTYSSMYAFKKPFATATFEDELIFGTESKVWLILVQTEIPTALVLLDLVKNNIKALLLFHWLIIVGLSLAIGSTVMQHLGIISLFWWVVLTGSGIYMPYIPFNCLLFDRLIAAFKSAGNFGFLMYLATSFCYLGSLGIIVIKQFSILESISWYNFYMLGILIFLSISILLILFLRFCFGKKLKKQALSFATDPFQFKPSLN